MLLKMPVVIEMKTFAGKHVIHEEEKITKYGEEYVIAVQLDGFRMGATAYKSARDKITFVARVGEWGVNFHRPTWYWKEGRKYERNIATFGEAKRIATKWLRELCKRHP